MFCSPVLRARETAEILCSALGVPYQVTEALREYDCGILEEHSDEESWKLHGNYFNDWMLHGNYENKPEGGECFLDIQNRFVPFIDSLKQNAAYKDQNILLVGHGGLFLLMLPLLLTNVDNDFVSSQGIGHTECIIAEWILDELTCNQWGEHSFDLSRSERG
jgi:broad specificity phosphatase PhoE